MRTMTTEEAMERLERHAGCGRRMLIGLTGPPGCGKSTFAGAAAARLRARMRVVGMDGFHLAQSELERLGRAERKGAPDTFDAAGYLALLRRLRDPAPDETVYAPEFRRTLEEAIAGAVAVPRDVPLVLTEGNYLLLEAHPWSALRHALDEVWYLYADEDRRRERLIARHLAHGRTPAQARTWALGSDEANARLVRATRQRADLAVAVD